MMRPEPVVETPLDTALAAPEPRRDRVVVRRRRSKSRHPKPSWTPASRRKVVRTFFVCVGALMLMAVVVYFGLARSNALP
jgi:hypothetical protein